MIEIVKKKVLCYPLWLYAILALSFFTRFYHLGSWPEAFAADEAALGYNGWSILRTAKDEWGAFLPLTLRSIDDWKPAIYSYFTIPGIAVLGLNEMTARLPAAVFGSFLPLFLFNLVKKITKNQTLALLSALMVVLSPWHIEVSRTAIEAGVALSLFVLSLSLMVEKNETLKWWGVGVLLLTLFTYHTSRLVAPFVVLAGVWFGVLEIKKKTTFALLSLAVLGIVLSVTASSNRFAQISIFNDMGAQLKREEAIREDGGIITSSLVETRMFHNKPFSWLLSFSESYIANTSPSFLFLGGAQPPRVTIPETGQFLLIFLPFFILGLGTLARDWTSSDKWLVFWLVLSPIPVALTYAEIPHQYRTLFMLPPIAVVIAKGLNAFYLWSNSYFITLRRFMNFSYILGMVLFVLFFFARSQHQYRVHQQVHQPWYRQAGYERLLSYLDTLDQAENITVTNREGEPYIFLLFYRHILPEVYHEWPEKRLSHVDIEAGKTQWQLFEFTFSELACPFDEQDTNPNNIYVSLPNCDLPESYERLKTIDFLDGNPEFLVSHPIAVEAL